MADDTARTAPKHRQLNWHDAVCDWCGQIFQASRSDARYCSPSCRSKRWWRSGGEKQREARYELTCQECGEVFKAVFPHTKFCSEQCKRHHRAPATRRPPLSPRVCAECGDGFQPKLATGRFCSPRCRIKWHRCVEQERRTARNRQERAARPKKTCPECGNPVKRIQKKLDPFCSRLCARLRWEREHPNEIPLRSKATERTMEWYATAKADPVRWAALQEQARQRYEATRETIIAAGYRRRHGVSAEELSGVLWVLQDGKCYLCGDPLISDDPRAVVVDHDHECCSRGRSCPLCRRGLACRSCNLLVGHAKDDPDRLRQVADNLERANAAVRQRMADAQGVLFWVA